MKLVPIWPPLPAFKAVCTECGKPVWNEDAYADLDGEPFKSYRHRECP